MLLNVCMCLLLADADADSARAVLALAAAQVARPTPKAVAPAPAKDQPCCETHTTPLAAGSYLAARGRAIRENKPLIVWVGGNFCDRCVKDSTNEFVHHFAADGWEGHRGPATAVFAPHGDDLWTVGVVTRWTVGSHDWGHVPSARRLVAQWRVRASQGNLAQLRLLNFGDGDGNGRWGWEQNDFYRNHISNGGYRNSAPVKARPKAPAASMRSTAPMRSTGASC